MPWTKRPTFAMLILLFAGVQTSEAGRHPRQAFVLGHQDPNVCTPPDGGQGRCLPVLQCPKIYSILSSRPIPSHLFNYLRQSICRRDSSGRPMFCCAQGGSGIQPASITAGSSSPSTTTSSPITTTTTISPPPTTIPITPPPTQTPTQSSVLSTAVPTQLPTEPPTEVLAELQATESTIELVGTTFGSNPFELSTTGEPFVSTTIVLSELREEVDETGSVAEADSGEADSLLPRLSQCGNSNVTLPRIVGGRDVNQGDWPWVAALGYDNGRGNISFTCGGALISSRYVLTAAHCVQGQPSLRVVRLGEHDLSRTDEVTHEDLGIESKMSHEKYDVNFSNDIALLRLDRDVIFKKHISPICLPRFPSFKEPEVGARPYVTGWGSVQYNQRSSNILRDVAVPVVNSTSCAESYARFRTVTIDERILCAGYADGGKDACQGDSGGPLIHPVYNPGEATKYYLVGVVSLGYRCAEAGYPGIYSRVSHFMPWILKNIS